MDDVTKKSSQIHFKNSCISGADQQLSSYLTKYKMQADINNMDLVV